MTPLPVPELPVESVAAGGLPADWRTLREIDASMNRSKGWAFRAFKSLVEGSANPPVASAWCVDRHYRLYRRHQDPAAFDALVPRLYTGSLTAILVSPAMAAAIAVSASPRPSR